MVIMVGGEYSRADACRHRNPVAARSVCRVLRRDRWTGPELPRLPASASMERKKGAGYFFNLELVRIRIDRTKRYRYEMAPTG
jgi:hypothetical protein